MLNEVVSQCCEQFIGFHSLCGFKRPLFNLLFLQQVNLGCTLALIGCERSGVGFGGDSKLRFDSQVLAASMRMLLFLDEEAERRWTAAQM